MEESPLSPNKGLKFTLMQKGCFGEDAAATVKGVGAAAAEVGIIPAR
jgi:hypothetical protein